MELNSLIIAIQWFFLGYFILLNAGYIILCFISYFSLSRYMKEQSLEALPQSHAGFELPISIIAPAYNEEKTIEASLRSLLLLNYREYEVIVVNDGSTDQTMEVLISKFSLKPFPHSYSQELKTKPINGIYCSSEYPNLRVIEKENGGKADALNAGINISHYPLFCAIDADSILQRDSLQKIVQPFLDDPNTVACGGAIRIANGCNVSGGVLVNTGLPKNPLALFQIIEYLRSFLYGRLGWAPLNALLIISGAFGLFDKKTVIRAGGYNPKTVGEDMELVMRLHRLLKKEKKKYRICFLPDPICWTEVPEDFRTLMAQRVRWHRGLVESLTSNLGLVFSFRGSVAGWLAFPFMFLFELLGPIIEAAGYLAMIVGLMLGIISLQAVIAYLILALGFGLLLPSLALLLEETSFHLYAKPKYLLLLFLAGFCENFGYRQAHLIGKLIETVRWLFGRKANWGNMNKKGDWQTPLEY